ncbi:S-layer homology domain-containing protein [Ferviditalea candida]|uniref:S-layer homology domain-containing protein n=1 Tax=Ferviditalea candida TaxID=3108399 RepID=A0ABU5ZFQ3_9BACL|nr:S-layer homology domain-containing protein [Paenibacillaceae bacterium T2]
MKTKMLQALQKTVILMMVMLLAFSGAAMAEDAGAQTNSSTTAASRAKFSDIPAGYWAEKYVKKLALLGVVSGSNGMFKPKDNISREEAAIMAVGLMGLKAEAEGKTDAVLKLIVSSWAKKYVITAIDHKILNLQEELAGSDLLSPWGKAKATREWVAKLAVRAIGKETDAASLQGQHTDFTDDAAISDNARGYINEAVKLDIIKGKPDGSFDPKGNITRAEMAVMFGNAERYLGRRSAQIVSGTVAEIGSQTIKIQQTDGTAATLNLTADTAYYKQDSNLRIFSSDVKQYYQVTVVQENGNADYVEVTNDQIQYETIKGTLVSVSLSDRNLIMQVNGETKVFQIVPNVAVKDQEGNGMSLSALQENSQISVMKSALDANGSVVQIAVEKVPVVAQVQGKVVSFDTAARTVTVKDDAGGTSAAYVIPDNVPLKFGDQTLSDLSGLHIGDQVVLHLTDGAVDQFELVSSDFIKLEGAVDIIDPSGQSVYIINQDHTRSGYGVAKNAQVFIQGLADATLTDLQKGDSVTLEVNKSTNEVLNITVQNRQVDTGLSYTVIEYGSASKQVVLKDRDNNFVVFDMNDKTKIEMYGSEVSLDAFSTTFKNKKVDITYTGKRLIAIRMSNSYTGTISKLDASAKTVTIETDNYGSLTFGYMVSSGVQIFGNSNASLADLQLGDLVKVLLDGNQEKVLLFERSDKKIFKVTGTSAYNLSVQNESGIQYELYAGANVNVTNADDFPMNLSNIKIGDYIAASFEGQTLTKVQPAKVTRGIVKNVGTNGTLTMFEYGGSDKTLVLRGGIKVVMEASVSTSLTSLQVNNRAEVITSPNAVTLIKIIPGIQKSFFKYDAQNNVIMFKKATLSEQYQFNLTANAYIHQGDQTLNPSSLVNNDSLMIYMIDGKIAEVDKVNP